MEGNRLFGEFLRSRRARLLPDDADGTTRQRRRTPGLKREEVAQRAGISAEWYVKLEQERAVSPSAATVDSLGRALNLNAVELAHLRALAVSGARQSFRRETVPETLCRLVQSLPDPAYVTGQRWDVLAWNNAAADLLVDFGRLKPEDRNVLHWMLSDPAAKSLFGVTWADEARRMVSLFRPLHDLWRGDTAFAGLIDKLRASCPEFEGWWRRTASARRSPAPSTCNIRYWAQSAITTPAFRPTMTGPSSSPSTRGAERTWPDADRPLWSFTSVKRTLRALRPGLAFPIPVTVKSINWSSVSPSSAKWSAAGMTRRPAAAWPQRLKRPTPPQSLLRSDTFAMLQNNAELIPAD